MQLGARVKLETSAIGSSNLLTLRSPHVSIHVSIFEKASFVNVDTA